MYPCSVNEDLISMFQVIVLGYCKYPLCSEQLPVYLTFAGAACTLLHSKVTLQLGLHAFCMDFLCHTNIHFIMLTDP